ncbi:hypothetical protein CBFG_00861 [Clostridiales bacterium 1_7_47FAA]|nr:hypothetical protein CBFG_00861 [Clostridiales bacterium 1_7_47FAA]
MSGARTVLFRTAAQKPPYSAPEPQAFAAAAISFMVVSGNPGRLGNLFPCLYDVSGSRTGYCYFLWFLLYSMQIYMYVSD